MVRILGIESTAHTFGVGVIDNNKVVFNEFSMHKPVKGGIHPRKAVEHHTEVAPDLLKNALEKKPDVIAYSCCPGLGPCLKFGSEVAKFLAIKYAAKLVPVNHAQAHIDIGLKTTGAVDPVVVYVSGGNTQIIANNNGWKIFGETLDIALGNAIDKLAREFGLSHPGGPKLETLAKGGKFLQMPYTVKGMDLSYSGILTHAKRMLKTDNLKDIAYSFQEHVFSMLVEVSERAISHTKKEEVLLVGGVAKNKRLKKMFEIMCDERNISMKIVPGEFAGDNGAMIAYSGLLNYKKQFTIKPAQVNYFQKMRVDKDLTSMFKV